MKKTLLVLVCMVLLSVSSTAFAGEETRSTFEFWAQCTDSSNSESSLGEDDSCRVRKISDGNNMYVKHWVYDGSEEYTNYFRVSAITYTSGLLGGKWATVNVNCPITSSSYIDGEVYTIRGRGNTKHYDYDGNYRVSLHGWFYGDIDS